MAFTEYSASNTYKYCAEGDDEGDGEENEDKKCSQGSTAFTVEWRENIRGTVKWEGEHSGDICGGRRGGDDREEKDEVL